MTITNSSSTSRNDSRPAGQRRWILQHAFFVTETQARRYAALGIDVTTSLSFPWGLGDLYRETFGDDAMADFVPLGRLLDAGLNVGCGTDWGPKNVFEHLALAMTHQACGSEIPNLGPAQRITRHHALAMWTTAAARIFGWPDLGEIIVGAPADLTIIDRDPLTCPIEDLAATHVLQTYLDGTPAHTNF